jgi:hypothetical protein
MFAGCVTFLLSPGPRVEGRLHFSSGETLETEGPLTSDPNDLSVCLSQAIVSC